MGPEAPTAVAASLRTEHKAVQLGVGKGTWRGLHSEGPIAQAYSL